MQRPTSTPFWLRILILALFAQPLFLLQTSPVAEASGKTLQTISVYGGNGTTGTVDTATEVSTDGGNTWGNAYFVGVHPWGVLAGTSSWVNCGPSFSNCLNAVSWYRYKFFLPSDYETTTLTAAIKVDNYGSIYIDGAHLVVGGSNLNVTGGTSGATPDWSATDLPIQSYLHAGWNDISVELTDVGGLAGINYSFTIKTYSTSPIRLSAPGQVFTVTYDANGGSASRSSDTATATGSISTFPTPTRSGYTFDGWFDSQSGGNQVTAAYSPSADITLFAHWTALPPPITYSTIYLNYGDSPTTVTGNRQADGSQLSQLPTATRAHYRFLGWFTQPNSGSQVTAPLTFGGDRTLYGQWERIQRRVEFIDSFTSTTPIDIADGETLTALPTPTRGGYTFDGWLESATSLNRVTAPLWITSNRTLYAQWIANSYTVNVGPPGNATQITVTNGGQLTTPPAPTPRTGYSFTGWNTNTDGTGINYLAATQVQIDNVQANFALYPIWKLKDEFQSGSGTSEVFFAIDSYFLNKAAIDEIKRVLLEISSKKLPNGKAAINIQGWVQPHSINPVIEWLSQSRANIVKKKFRELGFKGVITVEAPGVASEKGPASRKSVIEYSWSNPAN